MNQARKEQELKTVDVSVELDRQSMSFREYNLNVTLTDRSGKALTIYRHSLPWVGWYSLLLTAVRTDALGTVIEKRSVIDDPGPGKITIKPGETLTGKISLVDRFPGILKALEDRDVIVFWSYQLNPVDAAPCQRQSGYVLLPKLSGSGTQQP